MCGIAGIHAFSAASAAVDREELRAIRDHMASRGPDGFGEWFSPDGRIALGHRRLSIIDLSERGAQPMHSADGRYTITFNGEIYNYRQLRVALEAKGRVFLSESDTEVLLHLYAEKGESMLPDLRGMFAFAIWDAVRQQLFLARDAFGIKPLYYANGSGRLRFASQVKALLRSPGVDTAPAPAGHAGFFLWGSVPEPWTLYRGIRSVPAGHWLTVDANGPHEPVAWCRISEVLAEATRSPASGDRGTALAAIAAAIHDSVIAHLVADVPVCAFLSAGIDSSLIAASAVINGAQSYTVTLGFDEFKGTADDEVPLAEELARQLGAWHSTIITHRQDFEDEREKLFQAMDQPSIDGVNTWFVARAARQMELKVALSGLGGDELFGSYPSFSQVPMLVRRGKALARLPGIGKGMRRLSAPFLSRFTSPKYAGLLEYSRTLGSAYLLRRSLFMPWELPGLMDPEMASEGLQCLQSESRLDDTVAGVDGERLAVSALEMSWYMRNQLLRDADWAGMGQSLEIRVPFLDLELLRAVAPWFARFPDITKAELAAAAVPSLPRRLLDRPKTGFLVPVREWIGGASSGNAERGLRGWATRVHQQYLA